jgi:hypothetical protein
MTFPLITRISGSKTRKVDGEVARVPSGATSDMGANERELGHVGARLVRAHDRTWAQASCAPTTEGSARWYVSVRSVTSCKNPSATIWEICGKNPRSNWIFGFKNTKAEWGGGPRIGANDRESDSPTRH